jgi:hypothetical protein
MSSIFAYAFVLEWLGFLPTTFLVGVINFKLFGVRKWIKPLVYSLLTVTVTGFLFTYLGAILPAGVLRSILGL